MMMAAYVARPLFVESVCDGVRRPLKDLIVINEFG